MADHRAAVERAIRPEAVPWWWRCTDRRIGGTPQASFSDNRQPAAVTGEFRRRVVAVVADLQPGQVVSYGDVATEAGYPGAARAVGAVLAADGDDLPWWRVVMADGRLAAVHQDRQAELLAGDGIVVRAGRVVRPER